MYGCALAWSGMVHTLSSLFSFDDFRIPGGCKKATSVSLFCNLVIYVADYVSASERWLAV